RCRYRFAVSAQALNVETDGLLDECFDLPERRTRGDTTGKVRDVRGEGSVAPLDDHGVSGQCVSQIPACQRVLLRVPGLSSASGLPAIVTVPGFAVCRN